MKSTDYYSSKVAWVVGASSGIGKEIVKQLDEKGCFVILSGRNKVALLEIQKNLKHPANHFVLDLDLEEATSLESKTKEAIQFKGKIDLLFNNGGISQRSEASKTQLEIDRKIMEINFFGNIALTKNILPHFQENKSGHIIVTSSIAGKFGFYLRSAYSASKHALQGFYESVSLEEAKNNIHITLAVPGKINTPISLSALNEEGKAHGVMDHNQDTGMPVETCVRILLKAVSKQKREVLIGNKEVLAVYIKRFFPSLFWRIIKKQSAV